jgi:hypothetical protein
MQFVERIAGSHAGILAFGKWPRIEVVAILKPTTAARP